jgi:hypothetical protein
VARRASCTAADVARCLTDWFAELGYLEQATALQIVSDEFGDGFMWTDEHGRRGMQQDVMEALHALTPDPAWMRHFASWPQSGPGELSAQLSVDG